MKNWLRVAALFVPLVIIEGYWGTYSASVVNGTSFDSIWPPIHVLFSLALLAGLVAPVHRAAIRGSRWAMLTALLLVWTTLSGLLGAAASVWPDPPGGDQFVCGGATILTGIAALPFLGWLRRTRPLDPRELLMLYCLLTTSTLVQGFGAAHFVVPFILGPRYFATPANHWDTQLFPLLPHLLFPPHSEAAQDFYIGHRSGVPWRMWAIPLALWTAYVMLVCLVMLGLNGFVRRLWMDRERLTFPQVYLPLEMVRQEEGPLLNRFFRSPAMWGGFLSAALLEAVGGIHQYFPSTPAFQFRHINIVQNLQAAPWSSIGILEICIYPCIIGLSFLLTVEVSGSAWIFYLIRKALPVLGAQFGWQDTLTLDGTSFPFADQQSSGAFLAIAALVIAGVVKMFAAARARGEKAPVEARDAAALGGGLVLLILWTRLLGMSVIVSIGFVLAFFLMSLAYNRVRAETGLGGLTGPMPPQDALVWGFGAKAFSAQDLASLGALRWSSWDLRFLPSEMPAQLESYRIGESAGISSRALFWGMLLATLFALVISYVEELPIIYYYGANQMNYFRHTQIPRDSMTLVSQFMSDKRGPDHVGLSAGSFGFLFTCVLALLRGRFFSFPLHPLGYAIGFSRRTIEWMWFSIFLGWAAKSITLKSGGLRLYRVVLPFFLGLLLGDFTAAGIFGIIGCLFPQTAGYSVYP